MLDRFERDITYLRISVTDRCNLDCRYCSTGADRPNGLHLLSSEEIFEIARAAAGIGINKIRLTGGEPLLRRDIRTIVHSIAEINGIRDLSITTNGTLLGSMARELAEAGLSRVNVSIDSVDPGRYSEITRGGDLNSVLEGLEAARKAGLEPVKLNCLVDRGPKEPDARGVASFAQRHGYRVRFIPRMDLESGVFSVVEPGGGGDCARCNRVRVSSEGAVRPCLFSDLTYDIRKLGAGEALRRAIGNKPARGGACSHNWMRGIGG